MIPRTAGGPAGRPSSVAPSFAVLRRVAAASGEAFPSSVALRRTGGEARLRAKAFGGEPGLRRVDWMKP